MKNLEDKIKSFIEKNGPITFDKFMEFALYDKEQGYYSTPAKKFGKSGDFYTSPTVHGVFGQVISNFIAKAFAAINETNLKVLELGCGYGYLASDILDSIKQNHPKIYETIHYICIDSSSFNLEKSKETLLNHKSKVIWHEDISDVKNSLKGVVLSNEFFDALPFHRIIFKDNEPYEIYVDLKSGNIAETQAEISSTEIKQTITNLDMDFEQNQQIEINLNYKSIVNQLSKILDKGLVLTIDYGYLKDEIYSPKRLDGTFRCFHNHQISTNPYKLIGRQDITSSVNFSELINLGELFGLDTIKYSTQGQFLIDWGILDIIESMDDKHRSSAKNLFLPGTMGDRFKILIQKQTEMDSFVANYPESILKISYQSTEDRI